MRPPIGGPPGGVPETPAAARQGKRARKAPAARSKAAAGDSADAAARDPGAGVSEGAWRPESAAQLPALLELLHWKTDVPDVGALLAPLCAVLRALGARGAAAPSATGAAKGKAAPGRLLDSDEESGRVSDQGCGPGWACRITCSKTERDCRDHALLNIAVEWPVPPFVLLSTCAERLPRCALYGSITSWTLFSALQKECSSGSWLALACCRVALSVVPQ